MKSTISSSTCLLIATLAVLICACGKKNEATSGSAAEPSAKILVGDITESLLTEIRYKGITDRTGGSRQGGELPPHETLKLDALRYKPLATHWAGIKSLEPIPGKGDSLFFRYKVIAELYPNAESAKRRYDEFETVYRGHLENGGGKVSKTYIHAVHFSHERVFYLLTTDMAASLDRNETGKLKFSIIKHLTE